MAIASSSTNLELDAIGSRSRLLQGQLILRPLRAWKCPSRFRSAASEAEDTDLGRLIGQGRAKIPDSGHGPADVITDEGSPFLTPELLDAQVTEATDVAAWMKDEKAEQEAEDRSPFLTPKLPGRPGHRAHGRRGLDEGRKGGTGGRGTGARSSPPSSMDAQVTEATDVAAWMKDEKAEQEAEAWQAGTTAEAGRAGQGPGVGQVTVGVAELLQLWDTAAALDQLTRGMARQTHLQRGELVEPTMTPALPEWELEGEDTVPMTLPPPDRTPSRNNADNGGTRSTTSSPKLCKPHSSREITP